MRAPYNHLRDSLLHLNYGMRNLILSKILELPLQTMYVI